MPDRRAIARRMREVAKREYPDFEGQQQQLDFDPLVEMLVGTCAAELARLENDRALAGEGELRRLAEILLPEAECGPQPAFAIAKATLNQAEEEIDGETAFKVGRQEHHFVVVGRHRLHPARIRFRAVENTFQEQHENDWKTLFRTGSEQGLAAGTLWLGIETTTEVNLASLTFFLDVHPDAGQSIDLDQLRRISWSAVETPLRAVPGLSEAPTDEPRPGTPTFFQRRVEDFYQNRFLRLQPTDNDVPTTDILRRNYPPELDCFPGEQLDKLDQKLLWLKLELPLEMDEIHTMDLVVQLNCFPVMNIRKETVKKDNCGPHVVLALETDAQFLCVSSVTDSRGGNCENIAVKADTRSNTYARRDTSPEIKEANSVLSLLRKLDGEMKSNLSALEEMTAQPNITNRIANLRRELQALRADLENINLPERIYFDVYRPEGRQETVRLTFWSTTGRHANHVPAGTPMRSLGPLSVQQVKLLKNTCGGREAADAASAKSILRASLLSRGKIVTRADIVAYCRSRIPGGATCKITVKNEFTSLSNGSSYPRSRVRVSIRYPEQLRALTAGEWASRAHELEHELCRRSCGHLPFSVHCYPQNATV